MSFVPPDFVSLTKLQIEKFNRLLTEFISWNKKINLSAIREPEDIEWKHFFDSLMPVECLDFNHKKILDLGSGGGFPVMPLSIAFPESRFVAIESVGKKVQALRSMVETLDLSIEVEGGRIEDFGQNSLYRESFDIVTARALAPWNVLLEYALPFVRINGFFVAYQGPKIKEDLNTHLEEKFGGKIYQVHETKLKDSDRVIVLIKKVKKTSKSFPRGNGIPRNKPLTV